MDEPHVEHAVGLIEHERLDGAEVDVALVHQVHQPAGGGDDRVGAGPEGADLGVLVHAAEDDGVAQRQATPVADEALEDLRRELTRRAQNQRPREAPALARGVGRRETVKNREGEGARLARARLGAGHDVAALKNVRDGGGLNGGRSGVAFVGDGAEDGLGEPEFLECHGNGRLVIR